MNSFINILKQHAINQGSNLAIVSGNESINYKDLYNLIKYAQQYFVNIEEENIILCENNQYDFSLNFVSLLFSNKMIIPVNSDITKDEIRQIAEETNAVLFKGSIIKLYKTYFQQSANSIVEINNADSGIIHMTSGSTGEVKYCIRTLTGLTFEAENFYDRYNITSEDKIMSLCPLHHSFALGAALMASLYSGSCLYTINKFSPRATIRQLCEQSITYLVMVPDMARLLCLSIKDRCNCNLRIPLVGAGKVTKELFAEFENKFNCKIVCNYGSTESGAVMSGTNSTPISSIGTPLKSVHVKLKDDQKKELFDDEAQGELFIKSDAMFVGYINRDEEFDEQGYYSMGDIAARDGSGNYYIVGRKKPIIKIAGITVNLSLLERVIKSYPGVNDCIVYTHKNTTNKEILLAMVEGENIAETSLRDYCMNQLPNMAIPSKFIISSKFERNDLGKVKVIF